MKLLRSFPFMALLLMLMSITGFCIAQHTAGEQGVGLLVVAGTLSALSWYITEGPRGRTLPRWVANLLTVAVAINVVVDLVQNLPPEGDIMGVLGHFTVWLTLIKLYERKSPRDYSQLLALSALLMLVGCLQSPKLLFGFSLLVYTILGLYVLLLYQVYCSFERAKAARASLTPADYRLAPVVQPIVGRGAALQIRALVAFIVVVGLGLSSVVFVLAPRSGGRNPWINPTASSLEEEAGFDDRIDLTTGDRITASHRIVATMRLLDENEKPVRLNRPPLLRGAVLSRYEGKGRWRPAPVRPEPPKRVTDPPHFAWLGTSEQPRIDASKAYTQHLTIAWRERARTYRALFSMAIPLWIGTDFPAHFVYNPQDQTIESAGREGLYSYRIKAVANPDDETLRKLGVTEPAFSGRDAFDPEIRELALKWLSTAGLPPEPEAGEAARWKWNEAVARAFTKTLQSPAFTYVTDLSTLPTTDRDPIMRFLKETRSGHCEYFASALTAMCRSVGVPARIVTGYAAVEYDPAAKQYIIRDSSAHAWSEVLTAPLRWTTFDPTPPSALGEVRQSGASFADWVRGVYDRLEFSWYNGVAGYDSRTQSRLVGSLTGRWSDRLNEFAADAMRRAESINRAFDLGPAGYLWLGIVAFALGLAVVAAVKILRRVMRLRALFHSEDLSGREYQRLLRQLGFYLDMLGVLDRSGYAKPRWQPPQAYARALRRSQPAAALFVAELTELFYAARYGHRELSRDQRSQADELLRSLAAALRVKL